MDNRTAFMIRVGADSGTLGIQNPLFEDGRFEYIPVGNWENGCYKYTRMKGMTGKPLSNYMKKYQDTYTHYDPDFIHLTYGDCRNRNKKTGGAKIGALRKLKEDDLLVFWAGFNPWQGDYDENVKYAGIIGWLQVQYVFDWDNPRFASRKDGEYKSWSVNAHYRQQDQEHLDGEDLVVVHGKHGGQLSKAMIIGQSRFSRRFFQLNPIWRSLCLDNRPQLYCMSTPVYIHYARTLIELKKQRLWKPPFQPCCDICKYSTDCDKGESG